MCMSEKRRFFASVSYAWKGVVYVFRHERNFRVQVIAGLGVTLALILLPVRRFEVVVSLFLICFVFILELLNTALEMFLDLFKPRLSYQAEVIKDIMAAIVFIASLTAAGIGCIIFFPYLVEIGAQW